MKNWKIILLLFVGLICMAITSCGSILDKYTPSNLPGKSLDYTNKDPNDYGWFHSLYDAENLMQEILSTRRDKLIDWEYWLKKEDAAYQDAKGYLEPAIAESLRMQEIVIGSEDQPYSILGILSYLGVGGGALFLGKEKLVGRNQYTKEQRDADIAKAREEVRAELKA